MGQKGDAVWAIADVVENSRETLEDESDSDATMMGDVM